MKSETGFHSSLGQAEGVHRKFQRIAIVGIGNEFNGDDAAGILAARRLSSLSGERERNDHSRLPEFLVIDAGLSPEAYAGPLRRFQPDLVILVDAAELGEAPGTVRWLDWPRVEGMSASTHTLPLSIFAQYLVKELGCQVALAGIQPKQLNFDQGVSKEIMRAVNRVVKEIQAWTLPYRSGFK